MPVADLVHRVAMKIHDPAARRVNQVDPMGTLNHVQARRGECLMQEPAPILIEQRPCLGIDVAALPCGASVAKIDVPFTGIVHMAMLGGWREMGKRAEMLQ